MNEQMCGRVRELIPDFVGHADVLGPRLADSDMRMVEAHVADCAACAAELALVRVILASRPRVPTGLLERVLATVGTTGSLDIERRHPVRAWWGLSAAAVAALALGIGMSSDPATLAPAEVPGYAYEVDEGDIWLSDDGLMAGAPLFDDLTDDALLQLLDELSVGSAGGSA